MKYFDEKKQKKLLEEKIKLDAELLELKKIDDANKLEASIRSNKRKQIEHKYAMACKLYSVNKNAGERLLHFILNFVETKNPDSLSPEMQRAFRIEGLLKKLDELAEKPLSPPKFNELDEPIE